MGSLEAAVRTGLMFENSIYIYHMCISVIVFGHNEQVEVYIVQFNLTNFSFLVFFFYSFILFFILNLLVVINK